MVFRRCGRWKGSKEKQVNYWILRIVGLDIQYILRDPHKR